MTLQMTKLSLSSDYFK